MACNNWRPGEAGNASFPIWLQSWTDSTTEAQTTCSSAGSPGGSGVDAKITSGVVALALKVSKVTCTPAEVLIGMLAKESRGYKDDAGTPFTGDPMEIYTRNGCGSLNIHNKSPGSPYFTQACGAYQYTQANITGDPFGRDKGQIKQYGASIKPCLTALSIT